MLALCLCALCSISAAAGEQEAETLTMPVLYASEIPEDMDLVSDEISGNPEYFKTVRAVKEENVYALPSFNNCGMNITYALMDAYYTGMILYPEQFEDLTMEDKSNEILTTFLGEDTFSQMSEGGLIYGTLNEYFQ